MVKVYKKTSASGVLTSFLKRRDLWRSHGYSSVTEAVFIQVGGGRMTFTSECSCGVLLVGNYFHFVE